MPRHETHLNLHLRKTRCPIFDAQFASKNLFKNYP